MTSKLRKSTGRHICNTFILNAIMAYGAIGLTACGGGQTADPLVNTYPVAYVKHPMPANNQGFEAALDPAPINTNLGAELIIRDAAIVGSKETTVSPPLTSNGLTRQWEIKDLEFSDDGSKLLFAARLEADPDIVGDVQTWDIYEFDLSKSALRRVIADNLTAARGDDLSPHYLLNGRIIFSSTLNATTRNTIIDQKSTISTSQPVTEGANGSTPSFKLHVMESNGTVIHQVSYGTSHDLFPSMMRSGPYSGKIIFSRWDTKGSSDRRMHLYMMNPDGSNEQYIYGWNSHNTGTANELIHFTKPMQLEDGRVLSIIRRNNRDAFNGGDIVAININNFIDNFQPVATAAGLTGPAQISLTAGLASTANNPLSRKGRFNSVAPYYDGSNQAIVSYGSCYVNVPGQTVSLPCDGKNELMTGATLAPPRYYVGVLKLGTIELKPLTIPSPDYYYSDVTIAQEKSQPANILDAPAVGSGRNAILHLRNVKPTTLATMPAYIRIYKHAYLDDTVTNTKIGLNTSRKMRELIGYAPVNQTDGSVRVRVPGDVPLSFELVNSNFEKLVTTANVADHPAWFSVRSGEERTCNGCHEANSAHGRNDAEVVANSGGTLAPTGTGTNINPLVDYGTMDAGGILNYPECSSQTSWDGKCRVIIGYNSNIHPLWVAKGCVACHTPALNADGGDITPGHLDLTVTGENAGEPTNYTAYRNIISGTYPVFDGVNLVTQTRTTIAPGSAAGSAFLYISANNPRFGSAVTHGGVLGLLSDGEVKMITEWIDMGAQYQNQP